MRDVTVGLAIVVVAVFCFAKRSEAIVLAAPAGLAAAIETPRHLESVLYRCHRAYYCTPTGCEWRRSCYRGCPDGLSCYPLYGAYGPWGGKGYWRSYTYPY